MLIVEGTFYLDGKCLGTATNIEIGKLEAEEEFKPYSFSHELSETIKLKNIKFSKKFKEMLKRQMNILKAKQLNAIVNRTRKNRIKKKLVKRIIELI